MRRRALLLIGLSLTMAGCGGSGSPPNPPPAQTTALKLDLNWAARSKAISTPSSALSAVIRLERGAPADNGPIVFPAIDRSDAPGSYTQNYVSPSAVRLGTNLITVTFFTGKGGTGTAVGVATRSFLLASDGTGVGDVVTVGRVQKVTATGLAGVLNMPVGGSGALGFTAQDGNGATIAVSPGSARFAAVTGAASLGVTDDGNVTGLGVGTATVIATVDGVTSAPLTIHVLPPTGAQAVIAVGQSVAVGQTKNLIFSVTDASGNPVTVDPAQRHFLIDEGAENITLTADGVLTGVKVGTTILRLKIGDTLESPPVSLVVNPSTDSVLVSIAAQQSVAVGQSKKLTFTATDGSGNPIPLGAGGVTFQIVSGGDVMSVAADGTATGIAPGVAVVKATVAGTASGAQSVFVGDVVTTGSGLKYIEILAGNGGKPDPGQLATVHYVGTLLNGSKFDSSRDRGQPFPFRLGINAVIKGFEEGVSTMHVGGRRLLIVPPALGYKNVPQTGPTGEVTIPANSTLIFDIELLRVDP